MAEDERHGQQYVAHYGCDQAFKVGGLDLRKKKSTKLAQTNYKTVQEIHDCIRTLRR